MKKELIEFQEAESDGCIGWKFPEECPHDGKFVPGSPDCKECEQDMLDAYAEVVE